jgi:hypothetical protein
MSDGLVEKNNGTIIRSLRAMVDAKHEQWHEALPYAVWTHNDNDSGNADEDDVKPSERNLRALNRNFRSMQPNDTAEEG